MNDSELNVNKDQGEGAKSLILIKAADERFILPHLMLMATRMKLFVRKNRNERKIKLPLYSFQYDPVSYFAHGSPSYVKKS